MLRIEIVNDGTANIPDNMAYPPDGEPFAIIGNYDYKVFINDTVVHKGRIESHNTLSGWGGLVSCLNKDINGNLYE